MNESQEWKSETRSQGNGLSRLLCFVCIVLLLTLNTLVLAQDQPQPKLQTVTLDISGNILVTEIANTPNQRYMGLSFRKRLEQNEAMLFVYPQEQSLTFTMRNTLLPLSIAFISKDFIINEIHDMPVGPNQMFPSNKEAKFALEVNQGWFDRNKIGVGAKIKMQLKY